MYDQDFELSRRINVLAALDPEVGEALAIGSRSRGEGMRYQAERLARQGRLRAGTSVEEAAWILWLVTDFRTFDGLRSTWGLTSAQIGDFLARVAARHIFAG